MAHLQDFVCRHCKAIIVCACVCPLHRFSNISREREMLRPDSFEKNYETQRKIVVQLTHVQTKKKANKLNQQLRSLND